MVSRIYSMNKSWHIQSRNILMQIMTMFETYIWKLVEIHNKWWHCAHLVCLLMMALRTLKEVWQGLPHLQDRFCHSPNSPNLTLSRSYLCSDSMSVKVLFLNPRVGDDGVEVPNDSEIELLLTLPDCSNLAAIPIDFFFFVITQQNFPNYSKNLENH